MSTNLNFHIGLDRTEHVHVDLTHTTIIFDGIIESIIGFINHPIVEHARVIMPYISHRGVIDALESLQSCHIITNKSKTKFKRSTKVKRITVGRSKSTSIVHTKAIILMDQSMVPVFTITGSCNCSGGSSTNVEMITVFQESEIGYKLLEEFDRILNI